MKLLPHERHRHARALRWLRDFAPGAVRRAESGAPPVVALDPLNETELDDIHSAETAAALTWAIEELER